MRRISRVEFSARQFVLRNVAPACLEMLHKASRLAETRFRRSFAVQRHVRGSGVEVGAAATPALVPVRATVKYVDKYDVNTLRADPELAGYFVRPPDIIASAEKLEAIETASQDFVLAFSLLEHVQDALGSLESFHRVTRAGGTVVLSVPDKRFYGPDQKRPLTEFDHFARDYREGPAWSLADHFREIGRIRLGLGGAELDAFVQRKIGADAHTHFHVWDAESFLTFLLRGKEVTNLDYEVVEFAAYGHEILAVLRVGGHRYDH